MRRRPLALAVAVGLLLGVVPVATAADWADFRTPSAESTFDTGVTFSQPVSLAEPAGRVEVLLTIADAIGPVVIEVPNPPGAGSTTLTYQFDPATSGHILPNTPLVARWRLIAADDPTDILLGPEIRAVYADDRLDWKTEAGAIVRVHWTEGSAAFGRRALKIAEDAVRDSSALLGVTETEPVDFYIYASRDMFRDAIGPGLQENVGGLANAGVRTLFALIPPAQIDDAWVGIVIPHELTHLVFNTAARNPYHFPPRWLNEGLAVYVSEGYDATDRARTRDAARDGTLIPLDGLTGQFPTASERFFLAYAESVAAVDYLVRTYGTDALVGLIRSYAEGRTDDEAFSAAIGIDMAAFGAAWLDDVHAKAPTRFGPQPAPSGPVPAAWTGSAGGGVVSSPAANASSAPVPIGAASPLPAAFGGDAAADVPDWAAPLVAIAGILVVVLLLVAARRDRARGRAA